MARVSPRGTADQGSQRPVWAIQCRSKGSGGWTRGQPESNHRRHAGARRRCGYSTMQGVLGCGVAHQTITGTRRNRWRRPEVEARRGVVRIPRRSCSCGTGSSEKRRTRSVMQARAPKLVRRSTGEWGVEERKREGQWLTGVAGIPRFLRRLGLISGERMRRPGGAMWRGSRGEMERR